jgi:hypothetical protein
LLAAALLSLSSAGCGASALTMPGCGSLERVGLIAQSVPSASYIPCLVDLPTGWQSSDFKVEAGRTRVKLSSDRAPGHPVKIDFRSSCAAGSATPFTPRTAGGRSYLQLRSIDPRYAGTMFDVFPGGCVTYQFDFARGRHIALMAELEQAVGFLTRRQLALDLRRRLGVELQP